MVPIGIFFSVSWFRTDFPTCLQRFDNPEDKMVWKVTETNYSNFWAISNISWKLTGDEFSRNLCLCGRESFQGNCRFKVYVPSKPSKVWHQIGLSYRCQKWIFPWWKDSGDATLSPEDIKFSKPSWSVYLLTNYFHSSKKLLLEISSWIQLIFFIGSIEYKCINPTDVQYYEEQCHRPPPGKWSWFSSIELVMFCWKEA